MFPPERIVCLTEETTETLYLLGEQHRIVGISGYTVRPPQARKEKPRVAAFISADIAKILALEPALGLMFPPERIVCLTKEATETLYRLGEQHRIVGISGYTVRPPQARKEKPRVAAFISADIAKILALEPDLVLTFSDLQADIVATLVRAGVAVHAFNQRTVAEILAMIRTLGALVGAAERAKALADRLAADLEATRRRNAGSPHRPKVYFEEWEQTRTFGLARVC